MNFSGMKPGAKIAGGFAAILAIAIAPCGPCGSGAAAQGEGKSG